MNRKCQKSVSSEVSADNLLPALRGALTEAITDPAGRALAARPLIGGIDQFSDSTDLLEDTARRSTLRGLWHPMGEKENG